MQRATESDAVALERFKAALRPRHRVTELRSEVLDMLVGGLWHTTSDDRYKSILRSGAILARPDIPDADRWKTGRGPDYYPYVRHLGGVSLFDFDGFDRAEYQKRCPLSSWTEFVPFRAEWGSSVWIQLDRRVLEDCFISGPELWKRCNEEGALRHTVMPYIEAAYIGDVPTSTFLRAFSASDKGIKDLSVS